jgi:hypothetical protein
MIDLIDQAVHDVIEQRHLLVVEIPRACNKQVSCLTQDFGPRAYISLRYRCFQLINQRLMARRTFVLTGAAMTPNLPLHAREGLVPINDLFCVTPIFAKRSPLSNVRSSVRS